MITLEQMAEAKEDILNSLDCFSPEELNSVTVKESEFVEFETIHFFSVLYVTDQIFDCLCISSVMYLESCDESHNTSKGKIFCFS